LVAVTAQDLLLAADADAESLAKKKLMYESQLSDATKKRDEAMLTLTAKQKVSEDARASILTSTNAQSKAADDLLTVTTNKKKASDDLATLNKFKSDADKVYTAARKALNRIKKEKTDADKALRTETDPVRRARFAANAASAEEEQMMAQMKHDESKKIYDAENSKATKASSDYTKLEKQWKGTNNVKTGADRKLAADIKALDVAIADLNAAEALKLAADVEVTSADNYLSQVIASINEVALRKQAALNQINAEATGGGGAGGGSSSGGGGGGISPPAEGSGAIGTYGSGISPPAEGSGATVTSGSEISANESTVSGITSSVPAIAGGSCKIMPTGVAVGSSIPYWGGEMAGFDYPRDPAGGFTGNVAIGTFANYSYADCQMECLKDSTCVGMVTDFTAGNGPGNCTIFSKMMQFKEDPAALSKLICRNEK
jgi:hypothetical protein